MLSRAVNFGRLVAGPARLLRRGLADGGSALVAEPRVAVVLSGCGVFDGSEVHEASATLVHLSRHHASVRIFAPDIPQAHVINHCTGEEMPEQRNVLVESARIARGDIAALVDLDVGDFDAVVFPGGFGAAKNLSNFAFVGADCDVNSQVQRVLEDFRDENKVIALCCIAPTLAAKVLSPCTVTVGSEEASDKWPHADAAGAIAEMGSTHEPSELTEVVVDKANNIVTNAAFMCNASFHEIYDAVGTMITTTLKLVEEKRNA